MEGVEPANTLNTFTLRINFRSSAVAYPFSNLSSPFGFAELLLGQVPWLERAGGVEPPDAYGKNPQNPAASPHNSLSLVKGSAGGT